MNQSYITCAVIKIESQLKCSVNEKVTRGLYSFGNIYFVTAKRVMDYSNFSNQLFEMITC